MPVHYKISYSVDKASTRYYSYFESFVSKIILKLKKINHGEAVIIKKNVDIKITSNGKFSIDDHSVIEKDCQIILTKPTPNLKIGKQVLVGKGTLIYVKKFISIGDYTRIGAYVTIRDHIHKEVSSKNPVVKSDSYIDEVRIGKNVWIGNYATIFPGVIIGENSIIATYALVNNNVPKNSLVAGQPARVIKKL